MINRILSQYHRICLAWIRSCFAGALLSLVFFCLPHQVSAQHPFAHRFSAGMLFGPSLLPGKMHTYFQGDFSGFLRVKYNFSPKIAFDANLVIQKKFLNKIDVPSIPALNVLGTPEDVMITAKFTPVTVNVNYYLSKWDTKPYFSAGIGFYTISTEVYANFPANASPEVLLSASDKKFGLNMGAGMETFVRSNISIEMKFSYHLIPYSAPTFNSALHFPVDNPQIFMLVFGGNYYFR
ncbi:MAG: outer membrane beta-barrel protein [Patescibacteria group bacterium]|nr:outer membrane beta-barrel protein [Patescibacteria group bacterium]